MNESIQDKLDQIRPTLLSKLQDLLPGDGMPDDLKNALTTYLLLNPTDGEVRQARDRLFSSVDQSKQT